jgi:hypothetical protein
MKKMFCSALSIMLLITVLFVQPVHVDAANKKAKTDKTVNVTVTFVSAKLVENDHVGNEWVTEAKINGKVIAEGKSVKLKLKPTDNIKLSAYAEEQDKIPDYNEEEASIKVSSIKKTLNKKLKVIVTENRGRYSGNEAKWEFTFKIAKK